MLQRIQTVYLFLVFVFGLLYLMFPLAIMIVDESTFDLKAYKLIAPEEIVKDLNIWFLQTILLVVLFTHMMLAIIITFKYKRRMLQIRLGKLNILLLLILVVLSFFYIDSLKTQISAQIEYGASIFFPFISMILILLANRSIHKDEELVRSIDRIR